MRHYGRAKAFWVLVLGCAVALPLLASLALAGRLAWDAQAWHNLLQDPQLPQALGLTLAVGLCATVAAVMLAAGLLAAYFPGPRWPHLLGRLPIMLAVPHAAFAIGLVLIVAPSGWLLRLFSPWLTGFDSPPPWPTSQDPYGLGLMVVLVLKEVPFLVWTAATHLQRPDFSHNLQGAWHLAQTLGYTPRAAWWRVIAPQLASRMRWPFLAVLAYSLSVVDVAWVAGPSTPPTLAVLAFTWLQDADPVQNAKGAAAAWLLCALLFGCAAALSRLTWPAGWLMRGAPRPFLPKRLSLGSLAHQAGSGWPLALLSSAYLVVGTTLMLASVAGPWPFPELAPRQWSTQAWRSVGESAPVLLNTVVLGLGSALSALVWGVAWLEWAPARWRQAMEPLVAIPLVLPSVLWAMGLHQLALRLWLDGSNFGVYLAHTLCVLPYVVIALAPAYTRFDARYATLSASFGKPYRVFLMQVKWPMLRAALASALAVGFAVSVAQYLPTLFVGAGRLTTVTTEAIGLSAGGQRSLLAAFAVLQAVLPLLAFAIARRYSSK